ncbi:DUF2975 domain-containing protein [Actinomadura sp. GC306]|uniref:DUF2975 domain-containing protein n=1 Tax=Actinomadura sp. GC306 TaxID=2530367 RepID=UPI001044B043|nr:DUF2975 domain-containing protein [Actinomadura sp. GC306]TDC57891.1 DUF2975 domain-containing protein [Actinomadura sp. GC306]
MKTTPWWRALDRHSLEGIIGLALLGVGLSILVPILGVLGVLSPTREVRLNAPAQVTAPSADGMTLQGTHQAELTLNDPGLMDRVLLAGPEIIQGILILAILTLIMQITMTFRGEGDIFDRRNTRHLYRIAALLLVTATLVPGLDVAATNILVTGTPLAQAVEINYEISGIEALLSLIAAALAGAFGYGTRLRADTEGLV